MYVLSYQHILGYGQLLVLDESLSVLLNVSWYCYNCTLYFWANKMMMMMMMMNEVILSRAWLIMGWATAFGRVYHHGT